MGASLKLAALCCLGFLACGSAALAAGGGGGAMPSSSAPRGPQVDPQQAYREGVTALQARDYRTAAGKFRQVLQVAPRDPQTNYVYALALIGNGEARQARRPLERATTGANVIPDARLQLGLIHLQGGDRDKAVEQQTALATELAACGEGCARRAELQAAHDALTNALAAPAAAPAGPSTSWLVPSEREGRIAYAAAVGLINTQRYDEALGALDRAAAAIGPHADILNYMGFANRKLGRFDVALFYYREALALAPDHVGVNEYLGELYLEMGRTDDARRQLARLDRLCPYGCAEREELARWILASN